MGRMAKIAWIGLRRYRRDMARAGQTEIKKRLRQRLKVLGRQIRLDARGEIKTTGPNTLGSRSGALQRSLGWRVFVRGQRDFWVEVGPKDGVGGGRTGVYGRIHELGLGRYPARPFLAPALKKNEARIIKEFGKVFRRIV